MDFRKAINILGLTSNFTEDELKRKHKELAKKFHPDSAFGDEQKFMSVQEAFDFLSSNIDGALKCDVDENLNGKSTVCPMCNGNGWKRTKIRTGAGFVAQKVKCTMCDGKGVK